MTNLLLVEPKLKQADLTEPEHHQTYLNRKQLLKLFFFDGCLKENCKNSCEVIKT